MKDKHRRRERATPGDAAGAEAMKDKHPEPLRGDAAWRAQLKEIARRNDAARAAGARRRALKDASLAREAARLERRELGSLPAQPGRS